MAPKRQLMREQWDQFARAILTPDTPKVQRDEMRKAFYAGAHSILFRVIEVFAPDSEPTEADLQIMDDLNAELDRFFEDIKQGRT